MAIDDDTGDALGALISKFILPETDTYTLQVSSYHADESGDYTLSLNETPVVHPAEQLALGEQIKGELTVDDDQFDTGQHFDAYSFAAQAGQAVSITMRSNRLDTYLWLLNEEDRVMTVNAEQNDQSGNRDGSQIIFFPPVSGTYTILASSKEPEVEGGYQLLLKTTGEPTKAERLTKTVSGELSDADFQLSTGQYLDVYSIKGKKGESISLGLNSSGFDSYLRILDRDGNVVQHDDDSGIGKDAVIQNFLLPETGSYFIWVSSVFAGEAGGYTLSLNEPVLEMGLLETAMGFTDDEGIKISLKNKGEDVGIPAGNGGIEALGKGAPFTNANRCKGSTESYTAKVKLCIGDRAEAFSGTVSLSGPSGIVISHSSMSFTVSPNSCVTKSPFSITSASASAGVKSITATVSGLGSDSEEMNVVGVEVTPSTMNATESLDSGEFTCTVTPSGLSPSYEWLTGSANGAWPASAGNSPALNYSASTASSTKVNNTRWFAPTPSRRQVVDGTTSSYNINCKVTVGTAVCKDESASVLNVSVDMTGQCTTPNFTDWQSIQVQKIGAIWKVTGQGTFHRTTPVPSVNMPATSQFYSKAMTHENKHFTQLTAETPWKDLFDATGLYNSTLIGLTSNVSETDLRNQIFAAVDAKSNTDNAVIQNTLCDLEQGAFDAMNAVAPDFLELDAADWKPLYGCP